MSGLYNKNKTMKLIGKQYPSAYLGEEQIDALEDVYKAHKDIWGNKKDLMIDAFILGYIYGKRAERNKELRKIRQAKNKGYINIS